MAPLFMREITLTLKAGAETAVDYKCDVHAATIEPSAGDVVTYVTLCPTGSYSQRAATTYDLHLVGVQNWDAAGLAKYLDSHDGISLTFLFNAHGAGAPSASAPAKTGTCIGMAPAYGGERDTWAEFDVTLPISGIPGTAITLLEAEAQLAELNAVLDAAAADAAAAEKAAAKAAA